MSGRWTPLRWDRINALAWITVKYWEHRDEALLMQQVAPFSDLTSIETDMAISLANWIDHQECLKASNIVVPKVSPASRGRPN